MFFQSKCQFLRFCIIASFVSSVITHISIASVNRCILFTIFCHQYSVHFVLYTMSPMWLLSLYIVQMQLLLWKIATVIATMENCYSDCYYGKLLQWLLLRKIGTVIATMENCYSNCYYGKLLQWLLLWKIATVIATMKIEFFKIWRCYFTLSNYV